MERPRTNQSKVRGERSHLTAVLDASEHVLERGVVLVLLANLVDELIDRHASHFFVQLPDSLSKIPLLLWDGAEYVLQLLLELLDGGFEFFAAIIRHLLELIGRDHLPVLHGSEGESGGSANECEASLLSPLAQSLELGSVLLLKLLLDHLPSGLILLALERARQRTGQLVGEPFHFLFERTAHAGRKLQGPGFGRLLEVIDVAPVRGGLVLFGILLQDVANDLIFVGLFGSEREDVIAPVVHLDAERERPGGAPLPQDALRHGQVGGGLEGEPIYGTCSLEAIGREFEARPVGRGIGHGGIGAKW